MAEGRHIGNIKPSKTGKGLNIHIFEGNIYGTIPLERMENLVDEVRITGGKSKMVLPIIHIEMNKDENTKPKKPKKGDKQNGS